MKKYAAFFALHLPAVLIWAAWALPAMGESGTPRDEAVWIAAQILLPCFIFLMLRRKYRPALWITLVWGSVLIQSGAGLLGWALMGSHALIPVYTVSALLLLEGLGLFAAALKDLNWIRERNRYAFED